MPRRRRTPLGFAVRAALLLVLGVLTSVGVAWWAVAHAHADLDRRYAAWLAGTLAGTAPPRDVEDAENGIAPWCRRLPSYWPNHVPADPAAEPNSVLEASGLGWTRVSAFSASLSGHVHAVNVSYYGLPFQCLRDWHSSDFDLAPRSERRESQAPHLDVPNISRRWWPQQRLPLLPVLPGLIANTAIYAACWFGLLRIPRTIQKFNRRRRGQCPACGYSLAGLAPGAVRPECGG